MLGRFVAKRPGVGFCHKDAVSEENIYNEANVEENYSHHQSIHQLTNEPTHQFINSPIHEYTNPTLLKMPYIMSDREKVTTLNELRILQGKSELHLNLAHETAAPEYKRKYFEQVKGYCEKAFKIIEAYPQFLWPREARFQRFLAVVYRGLGDAEKAKAAEDRAREVQNLIEERKAAGDDLGDA